MAPGALLFLLKRLQISAPLFRFLLIVCLSLVVAASWPRCGEASASEMSTSMTDLTTVNLTQNLLEDSEALLDFKAALTQDPFNVTYWWKRQGKAQLLNACRPWPGITCINKRVTGINLYNSSLEGTISPSLGRLAHLASLNLSNNFFSGLIPLELMSAPSLEILDLGNNNLTGSIPVTLGDLTNLTLVDISNNQLGGAIPPTIGDLQNLQTLNISGNNLITTIPQEITSCTKLKAIDMSNNRLEGIIPFSSMGNLTSLHLQNNSLEGDFVESGLNSSSFPKLEDLDLRNNKLNGSIPTTIGYLPFRLQLSLSHNNLTGIIPDGIGGLTLVQKIDLSSNRFFGGVPDTIGNCISLLDLDVSNNNLSNPLPTMLPSLTSLIALNMSHNMITGSLPSLRQLANLQVLDLSYNSLSGSIPSNFVNFVSLQYLNVSYNDLTGDVPIFNPHDSVTSQSFSHNNLCGAMLSIGCGSNLSKTTYVAVSVVVGIVLLLLVVCVCIVCCKIQRRRKKKKGGRRSATVSAELHTRLSPEEIMIATRNFNEGNIIGVGSMSTIYRGTLPDNTLVAVKRFSIYKRSDSGTGAENNKLDEALELLGQIRHSTLVKVVGYCSSPEIKALVLEYMPNGSLDNLLYPPRSVEVVTEFDWPLRFNAAIGAAQGLRYLHQECPVPVVHGDVKSSNILFDAHMEAKVADFGVARILANQGYGPRASPSDSSRIAHGFTAPEVAASGISSIKGDVYSYGIVLLEMISGRNPYTLEMGQTLPQLIRGTISNSKSLNDVLDPILMGDVIIHQQKMAMVLGVALLCTRDKPEERPLMIDVLKMLIHIKERPERRPSQRGLTGVDRSESRSRSSSDDVPIQVLPPFHPLLPHTPSLADWTPNVENR